MGLKGLIQTLSLLVQCQLDKLTLSLDESMLEFICQPEEQWRLPPHKSNSFTLSKN